MTLNDQQISQLEATVIACLNRLYELDSALITRTGMERSIAFRFGLYFHNLSRDIEWLSVLDLDLEYNKNGSRQKYIPSRQHGVQPDFVLHKRGSNNDNEAV